MPTEQVVLAASLELPVAQRTDTFIDVTVTLSPRATHGMLFISIDKVSISVRGIADTPPICTRSISGLTTLPEARADSGVAFEEGHLAANDTARRKCTTPADHCYASHYAFLRQESDTSRSTGKTGFFR